MSLTLDLDALLATITATASAISGIRTAFDHDAWPDAPPGMFNQSQALHLTGFPEEGQGWRYIPRGMDLSEYEIEIPLYTVVIAAAQVKRSRKWAAPYIDRYRAAFDTRTSILGVGTGNTGSLLYTGGRVVRQIPDWDGYTGFYMLRHSLTAHVKGAVDRG
jgi:hypothetical protein